MDGGPLDGEDRSERLRGHDWFEIRERVLDRDDHTCQNCGSTTNLVAHHIVPIKTSGTNRLTNLTTLCRKCHRHAHNERVRDSSNSQTGDASRYLLTVDELRQVIQSATHPLDEAVITTLVKTGIGVGELCNLSIDDLQLPDNPSFTVSDIDLDNLPLLRVRYGGDLPYNNRRERKETTFIPIDGELTFVLKRWLAVRPDSFDGSPLFTSTRERWGHRISRDTTGHIVKSHGESVGLYDEDSEMKNLTPYSLRYFFEERFTGQPAVREYVLGRRTDIDWTVKEIATHYRQHVFGLGLP
jgi:integrase